MKTDFDIVIIGGGIIGASIFYHLSKEHYRVALIEKNEIASGCTQSSGGIIRCFHMDPFWADKSLYGWKYYRKFESNTGMHCGINQCGFLYVPINENALQAQIQADRLSHSITIKCLKHSDIQQQFGDLFIQPPHYAVFEPEAVYINPAHAARAWMEAGIHCNGMVYEHTHVAAIKLNRVPVLIETHQGNISAKIVVIAAGSYTPEMLDQLGFQHHLYAKQIRADMRKPTQCLRQYPAFIDESVDLYGRPDFLSQSICIGLPTNKNKSSENHTHDIHRHGSKRFKWVENSDLLGSVYSDDCYSVDGQVSVKALNKENTLFIASGLNGGGVKLAPWVGNEMTHLINKSRGQ